MEEGEGQEDVPRPTTPSTNISDINSKNQDEWWRPQHPPETYEFEEVRRQRKKGGYPWTHLNGEDEFDATEFLDDNLYEPVNPPPLHESGSTAMEKMETGSLDGRMKLEIPPEIDIVTSEGLDGLDLPDPHEFGFDGDREWGHSDDEPSRSEDHGVPSKKLFTAGIRMQDTMQAPDAESHGSASRPLTNKGISFDPATKVGDQEVPRGRSRSRSPNPTPKKTTTAFEILRSKAAGAADQVKQKLKIALPTRPKEGVKMPKKKGKKKGAPATGAEEMEVEEAVGVVDESEPMEVSEPEQTVPELADSEEQPSSSKDMQTEADREAAAAEKLKKQQEEEEIKRQKEEEKKREQEEKKREQEEKKREQEEKKRIAAEKKKEAEELKKQKEEEKRKAKEEADKKKAEEKAAKQKAQEEAKKAKLEEQLAKAREAEELERQKNEELLRQREEEAATKAAEPLSPVPEEEMKEEEMPEQEMPEQEVPTPTGTGSRKKKYKKTFVQLPHLPKMPDLKMPDFEIKRKVIKRSKTPPSRPTAPKVVAIESAAEDTENLLATQYAAEIEARNQDMKDENEEHEDNSKARFPDTPIFVTQPSMDPSDEAESSKDWRSLGTTSTKTQGVDEMEQIQRVPEYMQSSESQQQVGTKERFDKFGQQLKGFGMKSKEMASKKSTSFGATMKVLGKDLQKFGVKTSEKFQATIEEIKAKQEAAKARTKELQKAKEAEDIERELPEGVVPYESTTEPRKKFRFRRRDESQEEQESGPSKSFEQEYNLEGSQPEGVEENKEDNENASNRNQLLGRADRDWESPVELQHSREGSEERNMSSRDSPPGSSLASSTFAHGRQQGVIQEIDSDEFFLREKGISEGEDEDEINRFLVEELRQAFRLQENALTGFDLPDAPQPPERQPKKPPRKEKEESLQQQSFQTFPPERPRRKAPGYVSDYIKEHGEEEMEDDKASSNIEERGSYMEDIDDFGDDGLHRVKEELQKIDQAANEGNEPSRREFEDDGRYEPVSEEPIKPERRRKPKEAAPLYYNTVAGNEWMRDAEDQIMKQEAEASSTQQPRQEQMIFVDSPPRDESMQEQGRAGSLPRPHRVADDEGDMEEEVDESGYAVVHKGRELPRTTPRRKKRNGSGSGSKGNSLKRQTEQQSESGEATFSSLPRLHIVAPSRPQRNYSTVRPRRPPRQSLSQSPHAKRDKGDTSRPSTAIGIMHGRPLPPPPRPQRSPGPLNDLDQSSIERSVGARHYANFGGSEGRPEDINIGIQTDPVQEYENEAAVDNASRRMQIPSDSRSTMATTDDNLRPGQRGSRGPSAGRDDGSFQFPRRLHLEELEVDFLRVNREFSAQSIRVEHLQAPQMEVNSLTSTGPLNVPSIRTQVINSDQINCNRLSSDTVDLPTIVPPSFYNLSSPQQSQEKPEELRHHGDKGDQESDILCPYTPFEGSEIHYENLMRGLKTNLSFEDGRSIGSPSDFFAFGRSVEFSPEQSVDNEDSWHQDKLPVQGGSERTRTSPTPAEDDFAHCSELPQDSADNSADAPSLTPEPEGDKIRITGIARVSPAATMTQGRKSPEGMHGGRSPQPQLLSHAFKIAVLENDDRSEELDFPEELEEGLPRDAQPVLSGSLRLEYSRSPEVPSDLQVLHDLRLETNDSPVSPSLPSRSVHFHAERGLRHGTPPSFLEQGRSAAVTSAPREPTPENEEKRVSSESSMTGTLQLQLQQDENLLQMSIRFGRAIYRIVLRGLQAIIDYVDIATTDDPSKAEEQRAHMQVLLFILLILVAGLMLTSSTAVSFTPPKWEFLMPPPNL